MSSSHPLLRVVIQSATNEENAHIDLSMITLITRQKRASQTNNLLLVRSLRPRYAFITPLRIRNLAIKIAARNVKGKKSKAFVSIWRRQQFSISLTCFHYCYAKSCGSAVVGDMHIFNDAKLPFFTTMLTSLRS